MSRENFRKLEINNIGKPVASQFNAAIAYLEKNSADNVKGKAVFNTIAKGFDAANGSKEYLQARVALNALVEMTIPSKVTEDLTSLLGFYAEVHNLGLHDFATIKVYEREMVKVKAQASAASGLKQRIVNKNVAVAQQDYTGFGGMDYRRLSTDPSGEFTSLQGKVVVDVRNSILVDTQDSLVNGIKDNVGTTGIKYLEAAGVNETNLQTLVNEVYVGSTGVGIFGDRKMVQQVAQFTGINDRSQDDALRQIDAMGYITNYLGAQVMALSNFRDFSETETVSGLKLYKKQLLQNKLFIMPRGEMVNPNHVFLYGTPTTMQGADVMSGEVEFRVDQRAGNYFLAERAYRVAMLGDTNL